MSTIAYKGKTYAGGGSDQEMTASEIIEKIGQSDWNQEDPSAPDFIENKPTKLSQFEDDLNITSGGSGEANVQSDWDSEDTTSDAYIKNKIPIKNGEGEKSIIIGDGEAAGDYSVAGGTNDKDLIQNLTGSSLLAGLANVETSKAQGAMSLAFGAGNKAITAGTIALGANNISGCKGFYWFLIDVESKTITLTTSQKRYSEGILGVGKNLNPAWNNDAARQLAKWEVGDIISITNKNKYVCCSRITDVYTNIDSATGKMSGIITVDSLPFTTTESVLSPGFDDFQVLCPSKPEVGIVDFGLGSFSMGLANKAVGSFSHVEGWNNLGAGDFSHVEGKDNKAACSAHAEGNGTEALANYAHTEGSLTKALASSAHAEGQETVASGYQAHAEGNKCIAKGGQSHAEGGITRAIGNFSHAQGYQTVSSGLYAHIEGKSDNVLPITVDGITYDHTTDNDTLIEAWTTTKFALAKGNASHVEGLNCLALGLLSHAEGNCNIANADYAHVEGKYNKATGISSHAEGTSTTAQGNYSHAEGNNTQATGEQSHSEGNKTTATGAHAHIEGTSDRAIPLTSEDDTVITASASNEALIQEWTASKFTLAKGAASHVEGKNNLALQAMAHIEGENNIADNYHAHAEGYNNRASGNKSHVEGVNNIAVGNYQHVQGKWNKVPEEADKNKYAHIVGGGTSDTDRRNIHTLDWDGNAVYSGSVTCTDFITSDGVSIVSLLQDLASALAAM